MGLSRWKGFRGLEKDKVRKIADFKRHPDYGMDCSSDKTLTGDVALIRSSEPAPSFAIPLPAFMIAKGYPLIDPRNPMYESVPWAAEWLSRAAVEMGSSLPD